MNSPRAFHLLVVDDDSLVHQSLKLAVSKDWSIYSVQNPEDVPYDKFFHAAFVDMHLFKDISNPVGLAVIEKLSKSQPLLEIVAMSGDFDRIIMEKVLKLGAQKFLSKPLTFEEVSLVLDKIAALWNLRLIDKSDVRNQYKWIGQSPASTMIRKKIAELRGETKPILIEGETGTGKEVVSRLLNQQEGQRPFISINMGGLPENLFESEMFGHVKGAFTGADSNKVGLIEAAHGGDLFLDEIEALSLTNQAKLLRVLENGEVRKVGAKDYQKVQIRIIAASNRSLEAMVKSGEFREDLFYRLASQRLFLSPLRDRKADIVELSEFFLEIEKPKRNKKFTQDGIEALLGYSWPGNVRELKRICEQLSLTSPLPLIRSDDVDILLNPRLKSGMATENPLEEDLAQGLSFLVQKYEAALIRRALSQEKDTEAASELLKISRSNLYKKIKDYGLDEEKK